jgi:hypothetical protein
MPDPTTTSPADVQADICASFGLSRKLDHVHCEMPLICSMAAGAAPKEGEEDQWGGGKAIAKGVCGTCGKMMQPVLFHTNQQSTGEGSEQLYNITQYSQLPASARGCTGEFFKKKIFPNTFSSQCNLVDMACCINIHQECFSNYFVMSFTFFLVLRAKMHFWWVFLLFCLLMGPPNPRRLYPTSISYVCKVFWHLDMLWMSIWVHPWANIPLEVGILLAKMHFCWAFVLF